MHTDYSELDKEMKHERQYKIMFTNSQFEALKSEAKDKGVPMSDLIRNKLFGEPLDNAQHNVQDKAHSDPVLDWLALCERYPDLKRMYDLIINEHSPSLYKLNKTMEQHEGAIQELYKRNVLE